MWNPTVSLVCGKHTRLVYVKSNSCHGFPYAPSLFPWKSWQEPGLVLQGVGQARRTVTEGWWREVPRADLGSNTEPPSDAENRDVTSQQDCAGVRVCWVPPCRKLIWFPLFLSFLFRPLTVHLRIPPPGPVALSTRKPSAWLVFWEASLCLWSHPSRGLPQLTAMSHLCFLFPAPLSVNDKLICKRRSHSDLFFRHKTSRPLTPETELQCFSWFHCEMTLSWKSDVFGKCVHFGLCSPAFWSLFKLTPGVSFGPQTPHKCSQLRLLAY